MNFLNTTEYKLAIDHLQIKRGLLLMSLSKDEKSTPKELQKKFEKILEEHKNTPVLTKQEENYTFFENIAGQLSNEGRKLDSKICKEANLFSAPTLSTDFFRKLEPNFLSEELHAEIISKQPTVRGILLLKTPDTGWYVVCEKNKELKNKTEYKFYTMSVPAKGKEKSSTSRPLGEGSSGSVYPVYSLNTDGTLQKDDDKKPITTRCVKVFGYQEPDENILKEIFIFNILGRNAYSLILRRDKRNVTFLFMEHLRGKLLDSQEINYSDLNFVARIHASWQLAHCFHQLHTHQEWKIIHGDVKPRNILIDIINNNESKKSPDLKTDIKDSKESKKSNKSQFKTTLFPVDGGSAIILPEDKDSIRHLLACTPDTAPAEVLQYVHKNTRYAPTEEIQGELSRKTDIYGLTSCFLLILGVVNPIADKLIAVRGMQMYKHRNNQVLINVEYYRKMINTPFNWKGFLENVLIPNFIIPIEVLLKDFLLRMCKNKAQERPSIVEVLRFFGELDQLCQVQTLKEEKSDNLKTEKDTEKRKALTANISQYEERQEIHIAKLILLADGRWEEWNANVELYPDEQKEPSQYTLSDSKATAKTSVPAVPRPSFLEDNPWLCQLIISLKKETTEVLAPHALAFLTTEAGKPFYKKLLDLLKNKKALELHFIISIINITVEVWLLKESKKEKSKIPPELFTLWLVIVEISLKVSKFYGDNPEKTTLKDIVKDCLDKILLENKIKILNILDNAREKFKAKLTENCYLQIRHVLAMSLFTPEQQALVGDEKQSSGAGPASEENRMVPLLVASITKSHYGIFRNPNPNPKDSLTPRKTVVQQNNLPFPLVRDYIATAPEAKENTGKHCTIM